MSAFGKRRGLWLILLACALLFAVLTAALLLGEKKTERPALPLTVQLSTAAGEERILPWEAEDGTWYFFLPAHADFSDAHLCPEASGCKLNGSALSQPAALDAISRNAMQRLSIPGFFGDTELDFMLLQSANVPTLYIRTETGNMDSIYGDKSHRESASLTILDESGALCYQSMGSDTLKGHGNNTWDHEKKSFNLRLRQPTGLLGMGEAEDWVLISNCFDESNLRSKLAYDFANTLDSLLAPESAYVDLYLNGEYNGLYLMTQRLTADFVQEKTGSDQQVTLMELHGSDMRLEAGDIYFPTVYGRYIQLRYPKNAVEDNRAKLQKQFSATVYIIGERPDADLSDFLDLDSWVCKYLVDELFLNVDMDGWSSFYYWDEAEKQLYAGPIWDFDLSMGCDFSQSWFLAPELPNQIYGLRRPIYTLLWENQQFRTRLSALSQSALSPAQQTALLTNAQAISSRISTASALNSLRWNSMFEANAVARLPLEAQQQAVSSFLQQRLDFLSALLAPDSRFHRVSFSLSAEESPFLYLYVPDGTGFSLPNWQGLTAQQLSGIAQWKNPETGLTYDFAQPVTEDLRLSP